MILLGIFIGLTLGFLGGILIMSRHDKGCECCHENRVLLDIIERLTKIIAHLTSGGGTLPSGGQYTQISGGTMPGPGSNSIQAGGAPGIFLLTPSPAGSTLPAADTLTNATNDPAVVVAAVPGQPMQVSLTVPASDTNTSFVLAGQFSGPDYPTPVNVTPLTIAIIPATTPPVIPTGGTYSQLS
jgi:hypothetical protein